MAGETQNKSSQQVDEEIEIAVDKIMQVIFANQSQEEE